MNHPNDFYVHVASTDSLEIYPNNCGSNFTNVLPMDISFPDVTQYECCLSELSYNSNFYNLDEYCAFGIFDFLYKWPGTNLYGRLLDCKVSSGYYESPELVCNVLNDLVGSLNIDRFKDVKLFSYDKITRKFHLNVADLYVTILVKGSLIDILGLERRTYIPYQIAYIGHSKDTRSYIFYPDPSKKKGIERFFKNQKRSWKSDAEQGGVSPFVVQMTSVTAFLVYVDFVKDTIYGSAFSNVIKTLGIKGTNNGERIVDSFGSTRMYVPLKFNTFNKISVRILDFRQRPIQFKAGNVAATFHFRRKS